METKRKTKTGKVVSVKMDKTAVVAVDTAWRHPVYKKNIRRTRKYKAHDEGNTCQLGDKVRIMETRPVSKAKCWRIHEILVKGAVAAVKPTEARSEIEYQEQETEQ